MRFPAGQQSAHLQGRWKWRFEMKLKGNMVIELTDENTGEEERIEEGNMVTNAVNDILG